MLKKQKTIKYKENCFCELEPGDVFEDDDGDVCIKIRKTFYTGMIYDAIHLKNGFLGYYQDAVVIYPLSTTLHYERILEGAE